jgi:hypothetical protein
MVEWLVPVSLFWALVALYIGGLSTSIADGSAARQVLGPFVTFLLFLLLWWAVRTGLGMLSEGFVTRLLLPTVLALAALPLIARAGFGILGISVAPGGAPAH